MSEADSKKNGGTIFSKIINKEIPAEIIFESENVLAFKDIDPKAPTHVLIIPKKEIPKVDDVIWKDHASLLAEMFDAANQIANDSGIAKDGYRLVINCGDNGGQAVYHLHMHLLGGRK